MKINVRRKFERILDRFIEINALLAKSGIEKNIEQYRKLNQEYAEINPIIEKFKEYLQIEDDEKTALEMHDDPEFKDFAENELKEIKQKKHQLQFSLQNFLLKKDTNADKNVFLEIRAAAGGNESSLFVYDLLRMYTLYSEQKRWKVEIVSFTESIAGGYKEVIIRIVGQGVYSFLKFESGGHRVQRVPQTETQGRIHTSTCTVAVLPETNELDKIIQINPADIRVDTYRASGAGGQHINKTDSAVRITHIPTGIVAECQSDRSQHRNKEQAMQILQARIVDARNKAIHVKESNMRKNLIGSGERNDRIRTYNFPQGRITDHRINLTLHKIDSMMNGSIQELLDALVIEEQSKLLTASFEG